MKPRYELKLPEAHPRLHLSVVRIEVDAWTPGEARSLAASQSGAEGPSVWLSEASCALLTPRTTALAALDAAASRLRDLENRDTLGAEGLLELDAALLAWRRWHAFCSANAFLA